jgi:hypothetical protein
MSDHNEEWEPIASLFSDPSDAQFLIQTLFLIRRHIRNGDLDTATEILEAGIRVAYPLTTAHQAAFEHYLVSLEGTMRPQDEPVNLLKNSIERVRRGYE